MFAAPFSLHVLSVVVSFMIIENSVAERRKSAFTQTAPSHHQRSRAALTNKR